MLPPNFHEIALVEEAEAVCGQGQPGDAEGDLPACIHFIWVGGKPPVETLRRIHGWAWLNPAFVVCMWAEDGLRTLAETEPRARIHELIDAAPNAAALSDIGRFAILRRLGGVYLDADMEASRPIAGLLQHREGFVVRESRALLTASAVGLPVTSTFGDIALRLMDKLQAKHGELDNFATGPPLVTELVRATRLLATGGPEVLPDWTFFPENPFRFPHRTRSGMPPYGIHLFDHSWGEGTELRLSRRALRAMSQLVLPRDIAVGKRRTVQRELRRLAVVELASVIAASDS